MSTIAEVISSFPSNLQDPVLELWNVIKDELGVKREDFSELKKIVEELAVAQKDTTLSIKRLSDTIDFKIGGLGRRWGTDSERSFRNGLVKILSETGYEVINYIKDDKDRFVFGYPAVIEIDVVVKGDRLIVVEIKSSVSDGDVYIFMKKAEFYSKFSGKPVDNLLMITSYIDDEAKEIAEKYEVIICDSLSDIDSSIKRA